MQACEVGCVEAEHRASGGSSESQLILVRQPDGSLLESRSDVHSSPTQSCEQRTSHRIFIKVEAEQRLLVGFVGRQASLAPPFPVETPTLGRILLDLRVHLFAV
jgi:hypothetical protein